MKTLRRIAPALALLIIAPLIAEFLLGDFSIRQIGFVLVFIPQYGGGALLVRETTRRARRGWPTMLLLALAYTLIEEGFTTQTLFNPNYAGQRLLDYGFMPALGTSLYWTSYVLTLHVVWSVGSSVALAEGIAGERWREPWLRLPRLIAVVALFLFGCAFTTVFTLRTFLFVASPVQFSAVAIALVAVIAGAFMGFRAYHIDADEPSLGLTGEGNKGGPSFCCGIRASLAPPHPVQQLVFPTCVLVY